MLRGRAREGLGYKIEHGHASNVNNHNSRGIPADTEHSPVLALEHAEQVYAGQDGADGSNKNHRLLDLCQDSATVIEQLSQEQ